MTRTDQRQLAKDTWEILIEHARNRTLITYGELAKAFNTSPQACRYFLELIQSYCKTRELPPLTALVVNKKGIAGEGFTEGGKHIEITIEKVYSHPWEKERNPFSNRSEEKIQKDKFSEWMRLARKEDGDFYSDNSISQYRSYINSMPEFIESATGRKLESLFLINSVAEASSFFEDFLLHFESTLKKADLNGVTNFNSAFRLYIHFLEETSPQAISSVDAFLKDPNVDKSEKEQLIKVRIGQGDFRDGLIEIWKGCSVTMYNEDYGLLIASHIKPWSACKESRLNPYNGLLLTPNLDKVFDRGLITFETNGKIRISMQLKNHAGLGISQDMKVELKPFNEPFMEFHRQFKFKK